MTPFLTIILVVAVLAAAYIITITLAWGLIHGDETHYRADGPPAIDPHRKHRIHIRN